jgi:hypothetical protein
MKNKALLVGINKYPDPRNELRGCINDILDMENFISERNKVYAKENIKKLTDRDATKKGIVTQLKWLLEGAEPGDQLLFHYSGHGAQAPSMHPGIEKDGLDELICPYNFDGTDATAIKDKEFANLFAKIPSGVHFVWISDSCHAQDLSRDPMMNGFSLFRQFKGAIPSPMASNTIVSDSAPANTTVLNGVLLSACSSNELSADAIFNNRFNGAFTYLLLKQLNSMSQQVSMQKIITAVNKEMDALGYDQNPKCEGLLENKTFFL